MVEPILPSVLDWNETAILAPSLPTARHKGLVAYQWKHLAAKLRGRDPARFRHVRKVIWAPPVHVRHE